MKKSVSITLLAIILLQSCAVYNNKPVSSLYEAAGKGKVKVVYKSGESFEYDFIALDDNNYFGVNSKNFTQLDPDEILSIHLKNRNNSSSKTEKIIAGIIIGGLVVGLIIAVVLGVYAMAAAAATVI